MRFGTSISWLSVWLIAAALGACASGGRPPGLGAPQATERSQTPDTAPQPGLPVRSTEPGKHEKATGPAFEYHYLAPDSPSLQSIHARVRDADLLRRLPALQAIDGMFALPRPLRYVTAECGEFGAFYVPETTQVVLCYETLRTLYERGQAQQWAGDLDPDYPLRYTRANVRFIVLHETGHALVDLLDLPVTGRQEDAVDQLAAMLMLHFSGVDESPAQVIESLRMAANWLLTRSTGAYDLDAYADEHALGEQRYFNLQCLIYGTDPIKYGEIVTAGDLTPARAKACPRETRQVGRAWLRLLLPHLAPKYEMTEAEAIRYFERPR